MKETPISLIISFFIVFVVVLIYFSAIDNTHGKSSNDELKANCLIGAETKGEVDYCLSYFK